MRSISQQVLIGIENIQTVFSEMGVNRTFVVCGSSFKFLNVKNYIEELSVQKEFFCSFTSNPLYEEVKRGVEQFNRGNYDCILAVGGGSAIDVAKCIKLFCKMDHTKNYLEQEYKNSKVLLIAIPTTAGTGSESTRFAVIYYKGEKQSITHECIIPDYAILEPNILETLPLYQKKCTMLDALCQGIESWWSVNSTDESKSYSRIAIEKIMEHMDTYLSCGTDESAKHIMIAANYAGRAINITQTTAAHAMSYKLTSIYNLPHGHAVAICLPKVWRLMNNNLHKCVDKRGQEYLRKTFMDISLAMGCNSTNEAIEMFENMLSKMGINLPETINRNSELQVLTASVNPIRLGNNPVMLDDGTLRELYEQIVI